MPNQTLISLLNNLIRKHGLTVDPVSNLLGAPAIGLANPGGSAQAGLLWRIFNLPVTSNTSITLLSPDEIISQLSSIQMISAPFIGSVDGVVSYNASPGISMASTVINLPHAISIPIEIAAPSRQIAIYNNETLIARETNVIQTRVHLSAGKTPLHVVTTGGFPTEIKITLPPDITGDPMSFTPATPSWLNSGTIDSNYYDPATQTTGIKLFWNNQPGVGGWDVYKVNVSDYGTIQTCASLAGNYIIQTTFSGAANLPALGALGMVGGFYIGNLNACQYNSSDNISTFNFRALDLGDSVLSGTLQVLTFSNIAVIPRNSDSTTVSFVDLNVAKGTTYSYTIDSFSIVDSFIKSDKAQILTVTAADVDGIATATLRESVPGYLTLSLQGIGQQVRYWSGYIRRGNWPTIQSGSATAQINNDYLRFDSIDINQTTFTFTAGTGFWYGVVVPYDAHNNPGLYTLCSGQVIGTPGGGGGGLLAPAITQTGIDLFFGSPPSTNRVWWRTNTAGERPGAGNGNITVQVLMSNSDGTYTNYDITQPTTRYLWQDSQDGDQTNNTDDTSNSLPLYGSLVDTISSIQTKNPAYSVITYTINVYSGTILYGTYSTSISGNYSTSTGGGGGLA